MPKKDVSDIEPIQWTVDMIRTVLEQRELLKTELLDSKDKVPTLMVQNSPGDPIDLQRQY
jgi:hypothetical protein